jgi:hypothetical protein
MQAAAPFHFSKVARMQATAQFHLENTVLANVCGIPENRIALWCRRERRFHRIHNGPGLASPLAWPGLASPGLASPGLEYRGVSEVLAPLAEEVCHFTTVKSTSARKVPRFTTVKWTLARQSSMLSPTLAENDDLARDTHKNSPLHMVGLDVLQA